jgi:hypothetical protein
MRAPLPIVVAVALSLLACSGGASSDIGKSPDDGGSAGDDRGAGPASDAGAQAAADAATTDVATTDAAGDGGAGSGWWRPTSAAPLHFQWQLGTTFSYPGDVVPGHTVFDLDGENTPAAVVAQLHALGPDIKVLCYVDVGSWEKSRSDAAQFPAAVLGNALVGWPDEKWLDVRQQSVLLPLMKNRLVDWCVKKGFDAVEPDNLDGFNNNPGFPFTHDDNIAYDLAIADMAHSLGLSIGLKNMPSDAVAMEPHYDWALDEQCFQYAECDAFAQSFLAKGKAVWNVEYSMAPDCAKANAMHMNSEQRDLSLVGPMASGYVYQTCVPDSQSTW